MTEKVVDRRLTWLTTTPLDPRSQNFEHEFQAALLEGDPQTLPRRVKAAETAIVLRQQELMHSSNGHVERQLFLMPCAHCVRFRRKR
jgi:hypothetical protein